MGTIGDKIPICFRFNSANLLNINDIYFVNYYNLKGYPYNSAVPIIFFSISIIGIILNLLPIKDFIKISSNSSRRQSSMKILFTILSTLDSIRIFYWIISLLSFEKSQIISNNKIFYSILSLIYFSIFNFEFIFINFILMHFRKISLDPMEGVLKSRKYIILYLSGSLIGTFLIIITSIIQIGINVNVSDKMNICVIYNELLGSNGLIFLAPMIFTFLVIFQVIYDLKCRQLFVKDKGIREAYKINIMYVLIFSLMHIPIFLLLLFSSSKIFVENEKFSIKYRIISTLAMCSIPMVIGIIRNSKGFTKKEEIIENIQQADRLLNEPLKQEDQFEWLERHTMEFFVRDILISIAHCINSSKLNENDIQPIDLEELDYESSKTDRITLDKLTLDDSTVSQSDYLDVTIKEYAPETFAYLRNLEQINADKMVESFLPKNNKQSISESQGKSGSFFISTSDNQYMVKTLRVDEFKLIRKTFLKGYTKHVKDISSSLLCRIYGMYKIRVQKRKILVIVMRNVIGEFKDNIVAKYDLKGSSANRISAFDMDKSQVSTMKDLNFNQFEHGIMISRADIKRLRKLTRLDSNFLSGMELMDYSLFIVKLNLSTEEANDLFGDKIREKQDNAFSELIIKERIESNDSLNIFEQELEPRKSLMEKGQIFHNVKYYKQYLFPSFVPGTAYICAIIDYFQKFNFNKRIESGLKTHLPTKKDEVSCVDPKTYSERFIKYIKTVTEIKDLVNVEDAINTKNEENNSYENDDNNSGIELNKINEY